MRRRLTVRSAYSRAPALAIVKRGIANADSPSFRDRRAGECRGPAHARLARPPPRPRPRGRSQVLFPRCLIPEQMNGVARRT